MTTFLLGLLLAFAILGCILIARSRLASFEAQRPSDYATGPAFDIRERLNGPMECDGVIFGPTGRVSSRFVADFDVSWQGNVGTMSETFRYDSGSIQNRSWTLVVGADGTIRAEAADVVGTGTGQQQGSSVCLKYRIRLTPEAGGHVLTTTDWMYLLPNGHIANRSQFRKYGIKVAELVATMRPKAA